MPHNHQAQEPARPQAAAPTMDLEIKDAQLIFNTIWETLVAELGEENLTFPKEIIWLNGAPGAGKGTQTRFIMDYCGLTAPPVVISELLTSPEANRLKDAGMMVGDREVTGLLFRELLKPEMRTGVVVDGFPRTKVQVECLKLFYDKLMELRQKYRGSPFEDRFPKPNFHIVVLYVDEPVSVHRQLHRGRKVQEANQRAMASGEGAIQEVRKTDLSVDAARNRYRTFKEVTYESLNSLRQIFHYHLINAQDTVENVQRNIVEELSYQSSLELEQGTHDVIARIPVASALVVHARQQLVERLENYTRKHNELFRQVVQVIAEQLMPVVTGHSIAGRAYINSEDPLFDDPLALAIAIDVFSERGYHVAVDIHNIEIPDSIDLSTGKILTRRKNVYRFRVLFEGSVIRRGR